MIRKGINGILFFIFLSYNAFSQYDAVFNTPFPEQYNVLDSIIRRLSYQDTSHASARLQQLEQAAIRSNNEPNLLNARRAFLNYRYINSRSDHDTVTLNTLIRDEVALLQSIDEKKYPEITAMLHVLIGHTCYNKTYNYVLAFEHYLKAYDLFKGITSKQFPEKQYSQYAVALAYYQFNDYKNALLLGKEIETLYPSKNYISVFNIDMMGMCYLRTNRYDSAIACFQWILDNLHYIGNSKAWEGIVSGNIGNVYFLQEQYDKALPYLELGVNLTMDTKIYDNAADFASWVSGIYTKQGNTALAKKYIEIAQDATRHARLPSNYYYVYKALADFYKETGDDKKALLYLDSSIYYKDSIAKVDEVKSRQLAEVAIKTERKKNLEKVHEKERSKQALIRNGLTVLIFLLAIITVLYYNRVRLKKKYRQQQLLAEKQLAEAVRKNAALQLKDFTQSVITKDDDEWKDFTVLFNKVHPSFLKKLREKVPDLSPAETRFIALSKLKLNSREMAGMLGMSADAIEQNKSRLIKKLNLTNESGAIEKAIDEL